MRPDPARFPGAAAAAEHQLRAEYSRRLAIAIEAELNQAEAQRRPPNLHRVRDQVASELGLDAAELAELFSRQHQVERVRGHPRGDAVAAIARGLAGDPAAKARLAELLAELRARVERLEAVAASVRVTEAGEAATDEPRTSLTPPVGREGGASR